jgi:acyl-CoA thioesterase-1
MLKTIYNLLSVLLMTAALTGCGEESNSPPEQPRTEYDGTILAVGNSLTEGLGVEEEFAYPSVLQHKLIHSGYNYRVINGGVSGETSSGALSRITWALTLKPDIVILVTGANDGLRGIDPELIATNITDIIELLKDRDIVVVLGGMQMVQNLGQAYTQAFSKLYKDIARDQKVVFIPFFLAGVGGNPTLNQADGIHPTAEGYRLIVENIYPYVVEAIQEHQAQ